MTPDQPLNPESLGEQDLAALDPTTYYRVVGPPLQVCAEIAAQRGDPTLHADMPAMLALIDLVARLADLHVDTHGADTATQEALDGAPAAVCVMVLQEAKMEAHLIGQCLAALEAAYAQLAEHEVTAVARPYAAMAWEQLCDDDRDNALASLKQAAQQVVAAIEAWQAQVH